MNDQTTVNRQQEQQSQLSDAARQIQRAITGLDAEYPSPEVRDVIEQAAYRLANPLYSPDPSPEHIANVRQVVRELMDTFRDRTAVAKYIFTVYEPGGLTEFAKRELAYDTIDDCEGRIANHVVLAMSSNDDSAATKQRTTAIVADILKANERTFVAYVPELDDLESFDHMALWIEHNQQDDDQTVQHAANAFVRYLLHDSRAAIAAGASLAPEQVRRTQQALNNVADTIAYRFWCDVKTQDPEAAPEAVQQVEQVQRAFQHLVENGNWNTPEQRIPEPTDPQPSTITLEDLAHANRDELIANLPQPYPTSPIWVKEPEPYREYAAEVRARLQQQEPPNNTAEHTEATVIIAGIFKQADRLDYLHQRGAPLPVIQQQAMNTSRAGLQLNSFINDRFLSALHQSSNASAANPTQLFPDLRNQLFTGIELAQLAQLAEDYLRTLDASTESHRAAIRAAVTDVNAARDIVAKLMAKGQHDTPFSQLEEDEQENLWFGSEAIRHSLGQTIHIHHHLNSDPELDLPRLDETATPDLHQLKRYLTDARHYIDRYAHQMNQDTVATLRLHAHYVLTTLDLQDSTAQFDSKSFQMTRNLSLLLNAARPQG